MEITIPCTPRPIVGAIFSGLIADNTATRVHLIRQSCAGEELEFYIKPEHDSAILTATFGTN